MTPAGAASTAVTRRITDERALLGLLPDTGDVVSWVCGGDGLVGWGEYARFEPSGPGRFAQARRWWEDFAATTRVRDEVGLPGTGPVAFAGMAFADEPGASVLVVPRLLVGRRDGVTWVTTYGDPPELPTVTAPRPPGAVRYSDGEFPVADYRSAVAEAVRRIRAGGPRKVVLAHDLLATACAPLDPRFLLERLAAGYPNCWTYAVGGLVGATPELLLSKRHDTVRARLLAGTVWPGAAEGDLLSSAKNRGEHGYGVDSLAEALRPWCPDLTVPETPSVLRLHNVAHLATEVTGTVKAETSLLRLAADVHPTAAVGGAPTAEALRTIGELERMDRGRYAGPVGWVDAAGDGEFGVALRCAQLDGPRARLFAGCGIVADSDPETEATEAAAKLVPVREALGAEG